MWCNNSTHIAATSVIGYMVNDGQFYSNTAFVNIAILSNTPIAVNASYSTPNDGYVIIILNGYFSLRPSSINPDEVHDNESVSIIVQVWMDLMVVQ
jgi:hypothetical protein